jgi:hypothetical protein
MFRLVIMVLLWTCTLACASPNTSAQMLLVILEERKLIDLLRPLNLSPSAIRDVQRNSNGTKLFVTCGGTGTNGDQVVIISPTGLRVVPTKGITPTLADDERVACFDRDDAAIIGNTVISYANFHTELGFSPGAAFYYVFNKDIILPGEVGNGRVSKNFGTSIYRTGQPHQPLVKLDTNFWPRAIYATDDLVDVTGYRYPPVGRFRDSSNRAWTLLRLRLSNTNALKQYAEIPVDGTVDDVDQRDQIFLGTTHNDFFPRWFLYDMKSGKRKGIGRCRGYAFFLDPSLAKILSRK